MNWRLALRLARREAVRRPGRTALVVLLIALPVCGMTVASALFRTDDLSPAEEFDREAGEDVDAVVAGDRDGGLSVVDLPAGSETRTVTDRDLLVGEPGGSLSLADASDQPLDGPYRGSVQLVEGRVPEAEDEVALSRQVADDVDVDVGDTVTVRAAGGDGHYRAGPAGGRIPSYGGPPGDPRQVSVVGQVEDRDCLGCPVMTVHPDLVGTDGDVRFQRQLVRFPDTFSDEDLADAAAALPGWVQVDPDLMTEDADPTGPPAEGGRVMWSWVIGATALLVVGIVVSAAFAVGARRQLTTLGQLSTSGASPRMQRWFLTLQGTVAGFVGVVVGWVLAALVLGLGRGKLEHLLLHRLAGWDLRPSDLAVIAVIGVVAATLAALVPARASAQVPTLAALAGRRPLRPVPRWLPAVGLAAVLAGLGLLGLAVLGSQSSGSGDVWVLVSILGAVLQLLGACAVTPALAGQLERLAARLHGPGRLAARSLARHRARTGAVIAAVAGCAALSILGAGLVRARTHDENDGLHQIPDNVVVASEGWREPPADVVPGGRIRDDIAEVLDDPRQVPVQMALEPGEDSSDWMLAVDELYDVPEEPRSMSPPVVVDEDVAEVYDLPGDVRQQVAAEGVAYVEPGFRGEPETVEVTAPDSSTVDAPMVDHQELPDMFWGLLISPERADLLDLTLVDVAVAFESADSVGRGEWEDLEWLRYEWQVEAAEAGAGQRYINLEYGYDGRRVTPFQVELLLVAVALVVTLFVVATSLALAAAENRDEREVLTVVGTRPRDLAWSAGAKAALLAGTGAALAVPLGLAPLAVIAWTWHPSLAQIGRGPGFPFLPPWPTIGLLLVVVPLVVALAATLASAIAQRARPVRISTATFE